MTENFYTGERDDFYNCVGGQRLGTNFSTTPSLSAKDLVLEALGTTNK